MSVSRRWSSARRGRPRNRRKTLLAALVFLWLAVALPTGACGGGGNDKSESPNLLTNPGFEEGTDPWYSMETTGWGAPFDVSDTVAHSGTHSAHLAMRPPSAPVQHQVYGAVQSLTPKTFPEFLSGFYRVQNWQKGTEHQYLQFVVIAILPEGQGNIQIRYLLAGTATDPFRIDNAKFVYLTKEEPKIGEWVYFERKIADDFQQLWGTVPENVQELRIFFEGRYDFETESTGNMSGDVYYDDLHVGSKADAPSFP